MLSKLSFSAPWHWLLTSLVAGATVPFSLAPFNVWPVAIAALAVFTLLLHNTTGRQAWWRSFAFGMGMYGVGISWVFVSIHDFGQAPIPFAVLLTGLLVLVMATVFALPFWLLGRNCRTSSGWLLLLVPAFWCVGEWLRTWLFTGFPWLFLGYGHLHTPLSGWAPLGGVISVSFMVAVSGSALTFSYQLWPRKKKWPHKKTCLVAVASLIAVWSVGALLQQINWTQNYREPVSVGIAQGNIPQARKWDKDFVQPTLDRYLGLSEDLWDNDWVVWPEAAIPLILNFAPHSNELTPALETIHSKALTTDTAFITGILYLSPFEAKFYNSIFATGLGSGIYHKRRLTPFGDYVPLSDWFGPVLELFNLPHSILELGPDKQRGLQSQHALIGPAICYEIAYPDLVAESARNSHALITVSNDAWFGSSLGPIQHMQIAQMRALETQRYLVRATNNGISGIVDDRGNLLVRTEQFVATNLEGEIQLKQGATPFMRWGSYPVIIVSVLLMIGGMVARRIQRRGE